LAKKREVGRVQRCGEAKYEKRSLGVAERERKSPV